MELKSTRIRTNTDDKLSVNRSDNVLTRTRFREDKFLDPIMSAVSTKIETW